LAKFREIKGVYPNPKDILEVQEHLKEKYVLKRFYKEDGFHSYKSAEVKKPFSENNSVNHANIFNETDFKFEKTQPSKFKKFSSGTITTKLNIETKSDSPTQEKNFPLTSRKTTENIVTRSNPISISQGNDLSQQQSQMNTCRNVENKAFDFSRVSSQSSFNTNNTSINTNNSSSTTAPTNNTTTNAPFTHDFTKSVKMMESLNNLYSGYNAEKKVDPLDQLFYQYNFTSGNNMRMNGNHTQYTQYNPYQVPQYNQPMYNNSQMGCNYGINSFNSR